MRIVLDFLVVVLGGMLLFILAMLAVVGLASSLSDMAKSEFALMWTTRLVGCLIATIATSGLLLRAWAGASVERQLPYVLPLLGGAVLLTTHWVALLTLTAFATAALVRGCWPKARALEGERRSAESVAPAERPRD